MVADPLFTCRFGPVVLQTLGLEGAAALAFVREAGLPDAAARGPYTATLSKTHALLERARAAAGDPDFGLTIARSAPFGIYGLAEMLFRTAPTVADGLRLVATHHRVLNPVGRCEYRDEPRVELDYHLPGAEHGDLLNEIAFGYLARALDRELDRPLELEEVWFSHDRPRATLEAHFRCPVRMGMPTTGVAVSEISARSPLGSADPVVHAFLLAEAERAVPADARPLITKVTEAIETTVGLPQATLHSVAHVLALAPRTLQRRLGEAGSSFHELLDDSRRRHALGSLARGRSQEQTAREVGLANAGSLRRAMKRWKGG